MYEEFLSMARVLTQNTRCTLMGSLCLYMQYPDILEHLPSDADFYADNTPDNILNIIAVLKNSGYEVFSWQNRIDEQFDFSKLNGRFYIRGVRDGKNIDITYEIDALHYTAMQTYQTEIQNIKMYDINGLLILLTKSNKLKNKHQLERLIRKKSGFASSISI